MNNIFDALKETRVNYNTVPVNIAMVNPLYRQYQDTPGLDGRVKSLAMSQLLWYHRADESRENMQIIKIPLGDKTPERILW